MSLYDLAPSSTISTSQVRLALVSRKTEIQRMRRRFPNVFSTEQVESIIGEIDRFLLFIDGSNTLTVERNDVISAIDFTLDELSGKVKDGNFPCDGYFRREKDQIWYYFICNDMKLVEQHYELLDMQLDCEWRSVSSVDQAENLNLVGQELRYLAIA